MESEDKSSHFENISWQKRSFPHLITLNIIKKNITVCYWGEYTFYMKLYHFPYNVVTSDVDRDASTVYW